jgi:SAM-dependent methyltransferase
MNYVNVVRKISKAMVRRARPVDVTSFREINSLTRNFGYDRGLPIDRFYISQFLGQHRQLVKGDVLEVAERTYATTFGQPDSRPWILNYSPSVSSRDEESLVVTGTLTDIATLPASAFDCFICTQTLNSIYDLRKAVQTIRDILRPGGAALITLPGLAQLSSYDNERWGDFWRFTPASAARMFGEVFRDKGDSVEVFEFGNLVAAIGLLRGIAVEDIPDLELLKHKDPDYPVLTGVVVRKSADALTLA